MQGNCARAVNARAADSLGIPGIPDVGSASGGDRKRRESTVAITAANAQRLGIWKIRKAREIGNKHTGSGKAYTERGYALA